MKIYSLITILVFVFALFTGTANAQTSDNIVESLEQDVPGQGRVTIHQDPAVEAAMQRTPERTSGGSIGTGTTKVLGFRVSVYTGNNTNDSKKEAERVAARIRQQFPDLKVYAYYDNPRPRWVVRVGDYRSYEEAAATLRLLRDAGYKQATIPPRDYINVSR